MSKRFQPAECLQLAAAPLAGIFLVLSLCAFVHRPQGAQGVWLELLREPENRFCPFVDRSTVLNSRADGNWYLNEDQLDKPAIRTRLSAIMSNRAMKMMTLFPYEQDTVENVAEAASLAQAAAPGLHLSLYRPKPIRVLPGTNLLDISDYVPLGCMVWPHCPSGNPFPDTVPILSGCAATAPTTRP